VIIRRPSSVYRPQSYQTRGLRSPGEGKHNLYTHTQRISTPRRKQPPLLLTRWRANPLRWGPSYPILCSNNSGGQIHCIHDLQSVCHYQLSYSTTTSSFISLAVVPITPLPPLIPLSTGRPIHYNT